MSIDDVIEKRIREAELRDMPGLKPDAEEDEPERDSIWGIPPGSEVMFLAPEGVRYGTLQGYDGKVTDVREDYHDKWMPHDVYGLPLLSNRDRTVRLDGLVAV